MTAHSSTEEPRRSTRACPAGSHPLRLGLVLLGCAVTGAVAADDPGAAIRIRDAVGHELRLARPPQRIVTLLPSLTETVCALDECARLVATDSYSNYPSAVLALPKAGGLDDSQVELIVSLKPDVVILAHARRVTERLRQLGIETLDVRTETTAEFATAVTVIGLLLGVPQRAAALNQELDRSMQAATDEARLELHGRRPSVYYEVDSGPYGAGPGSFIGEMLQRLGARNILTADLGPFPKLNPEYVVQHDPDVIFVARADAGALERRPGWNRIRAVRERRICSFPPGVRDTIVHPGPRLAQGLHALADCLGRLAP